MKSFLVISLPIVLVALLAGLIYMYKTGMIEEMLTQKDVATESAASLPREGKDAGEALKLSEVDTSTTGGLLRARDRAREALETQKREELDRQHRESPETAREKRLIDSMDGWLKRTD